MSQVGTRARGEPPAPLTPLSGVCLSQGLPAPDRARHLFHPVRPECDPTDRAGLGVPLEPGRRIAGVRAEPLAMSCHEPRPAVVTGPLVPVPPHVRSRPIPAPGRAVNLALWVIRAHRPAAEQAGLRLARLCPCCLPLCGVEPPPAFRPAKLAADGAAFGQISAALFADQSRFTAMWIAVFSSASRNLCIRFAWLVLQIRLQNLKCPSGRGLWHRAQRVRSISVPASTVHSL